MKGIKPIIGGIIAAILCAILFTFPSIFRVSSSFIGDGGDNYEYAGYQGLVNVNISQGKLPFSTTDFWRYPVGFDFSRGFDSYISVTLGAILYPIFKLPLSYNLTILILLSLNGFLSFHFFRKLTKSFWLGALGMIIYGFSFYTIAKASSHPNLLLTGTIPFLGSTILNFIEKERIFKKDIFMFFLALVMVFLGSVQYAILSFIFLFLSAGISFFLFKETIVNIKNKFLTEKGFLILGALSFVIAIFLLFLPHFLSFLNGSVNIIGRENILYNLTPSITDFFLPNKYLHLLFSFFKSQSDPSIEKVVFVGWAELVLFFAFLISNFSKKGKLFIFISVVIPFLFALGYGKDNSFAFLPYRFISQIFPFKLIAEPGRYFIIFYFFITCAVLIFLDNIKNEGFKKFLIAVVIIFVIFERLPFSFYKADTATNEKYIKVASSQESTAILDLPISYFYSKYDILSLYYQKPIVNGYFHWSADSDTERSFIARNDLLSRYICNKNDPSNKSFDLTLEKYQDFSMLAELKEEGIKTIVIHKDDKYYHTECDNVRTRISNLIPSEKSLEITSSDKQEQIKLESDGLANFSFFAPYQGKLYIDGVYLASLRKVSIAIERNGSTSAGFAYSWNKVDDHSQELLPKNSVSIDVNPGDILTFRSSQNAGHNWFSIWYRYAAEKSNSKPYIPAIEKLYEDQKASVYKIN